MLLIDDGWLVMKWGSHTTIEHGDVIDTLVLIGYERVESEPSWLCWGTPTGSHLF